jgi:hypothetical protein
MAWRVGVTMAEKVPVAPEVDRRCGPLTDLAGRIER